MDPDEKLLVRIRCTETLRFDQTVEMARKDWEEFKETKLSSMECSQMSPLTLYLDLRDPVDAESFDDIRAEVVDEEGLLIKPADYYTADYYDE